MTTSTTIATSVPTAEQVREHLEANAARLPSRAASWLPLALLIGVLMISMTSTAAWAQLLPWVALAGVIIFTAVRVRSMRTLEQRVVSVQEYATLRRSREALSRAWSLLPQLVATPELHGRTIAFMSHLLDQLKAYDAAIVGYDFLIDRLPPDHPGSQQLQVHRVIAHLATDRLADADDGLRKLRSLADQPRSSSTRAMYMFAKLFQSVRTGHYDDATALADGLTDALRPLGVDAGYGHGLMAYSFHQMSTRAAKLEEATQQAQTHDAEAVRRAEAASRHTEAGQSPASKPAEAIDAPDAGGESTMGEPSLVDDGGASNEDVFAAAEASRAEAGAADEEPQVAPDRSDEHARAQTDDRSDAASADAPAASSSSATFKSPAAKLRERAASFWSNATMLLSPAALADRYGELRAISDEPWAVEATSEPMPEAG